jgi:hypothetical protein
LMTPRCFKQALQHTHSGSGRPVISSTLECVATRVASSCFALEIKLK